jgi:hypothetical protein
MEKSGEEYEKYSFKQVVIEKELSLKKLEEYIRKLKKPKQRNRFDLCIVIFVNLAN